MTKIMNALVWPHDFDDSADVRSGLDADHRPVEWFGCSPPEGAVGVRAMDIVELAHDLAAIASGTTDPEMGHQLMEVVERILRAAGLPSASV